ncbi:hypothetical protein Bpfe_020606 [Biomphalaria pfeifferi]|uniref:Uncharacterized protein n=1 Tax=Biomphalaria pfeifferi TaxID=112525 RepID=A0AAD8BB11_BIOPF|nr:hypothetical protein Bpfe_020606 [Biomphalaria pfeifferi]
MADDAEQPTAEITDRVKLRQFVSRKPSDTTGNTPLDTTGNTPLEITRNGNRARKPSDTTGNTPLEWDLPSAVKMPRDTLLENLREWDPPSDTTGNTPLEWDPPSAVKMPREIARNGNCGTSLEKPREWDLPSEEQEAAIEKLRQENKELQNKLGKYSGYFNITHCKYPTLQTPL